MAISLSNIGKSERMERLRKRLHKQKDQEKKRSVRLKHFRAIGSIFGVIYKDHYKSNDITGMLIENNKFFCISKNGLVSTTSPRYKKVVEMYNIGLNPQFISDDERDGLIGMAVLDNYMFLSHTESSGDLVVIRLMMGDTLSKRQVVKRFACNDSRYRGGHLFSHQRKVYLSANDCIWEIDSSLNARPVASGFVCPCSFSIDSQNRMWVGDDTDLYGKIYSFPLTQGTTDVKTIEPVFEYPYTDITGRGIVAGFYLDDLEIYLFADRDGYMGCIQQRDSRWVQVMNQCVFVETIYKLYGDFQNKCLYACTSSGIKMCSIYPLENKASIR